MAKIKSTLPNMVLVLTAISVISASALAAVYGLTKDTIDAAKAAKELKAVSAVLGGEYANEPNKDAVIVKDSSTGEDIKIFPAKKSDGKLESIAIKTFSNKGFGGRIELMVGMWKDGTINKVEVTDQKETPGLGTKMAEPAFKNQFEGKNPAKFVLKVKKDGGDVDAITAATISSRAASDALQKAYDAYWEYTGKAKTKSGNNASASNADTVTSATVKSY